MENVLTDNKKRCIEWAVDVPNFLNRTYFSNTFLFQDRDCNLEFYTGNNHALYPYLTFKCNGELQWPATVTVHVVSNSESLGHQTTSIKSSSEDIWNYRKSTWLGNRRLKFEVIFHINCSNDDKSVQVQTPSYIDNCFLMDGVSQDFSKMLSEGPCHDLEFICGDQSIKAHKGVLCSRSDVFASMLQSDMVEGKTGRVNIQDMDATLFRQFLRCLYTGILPPLTDDIALQFYEAGDKYNISSLKKQCADYLVDNLSENAYDILILADQHNDPNFKKNVIDFMVKKQIPYSSEKWTDFSQKHPTLAIEVLNLFFEHLRPKLNS